MTSAADLMSMARSRLICNHPFFGALALRLKLIEDPSVPTLSVNTRVIRYNPKFVSQWDDRQRETLLAHEVMHCVLDHGSRLLGRHHGKWNKAADYAINWILQTAGFRPIPGWLCDAQFADMTADAIYDLLPDEPDSKNPPLDNIEPNGGADSIEDVITWKIATIQAAHAAKGTGHLPGSLQRLVDDMTTPRINWREYLQRFATQFSKDDYAWSRPNRKAMANGFILPGMSGQVVDNLTVVVDTSGSVTQELLNAFGAEINAIHQSIKPKELRVIYCDAQINRVDTYSPHESVELEMLGGGGTDFRPPFEHLADEGITPTCLIYLTDMYGPFPAPVEYPVLWCATSDHVGPFGETIQLEV